jgi:hypothetical protein
MIQEIITYIIILAASLYTFYGLYKLILPGKVKRNSHQCTGSCSGCALKYNHAIQHGIGKYSL